MNLLLNKIAWTTTLIFLASIVFNSEAQAQRKSGGSSLGELGCRKFSGTTDYDRGFNTGGYWAVNNDTIIGGELLSSFAVLGNNYDRSYSYFGIYKFGYGPEKVACRLAPVNGSSEFRSLVLQFGLSDASNLLDGSVAVRLRVLLNGEPYGDKLITKGDLIRWSIPLVSKRNITLEGECIRPKSGEMACPNIVFTQDLLTR